jgi:hypothetical protein
MSGRFVAVCGGCRQGYRLDTARRIISLLTGTSTQYWFVEPMFV